MFGLLKKKFNDLSEKIFGKSKEKIDSEKEDASSFESQEPLDNQEFLKNQDLSSSDSLKDDSVVLEKPSIPIEKPSVKEEVIKEAPVKENFEKVTSFDAIEDVKKSSDNKDNSLNIGQIDKSVEDSEKLISEKPSFEKTPVLEKPSFKEEVKSVIKKEEVKPFFKKEDAVVKEKIIEKEVSLKKDSLNLGQESFKEETILDLKEHSQAYKNLESKKVEDVKKSTLTKIKSLFSSKVKLSEKEISSFLEDFEISLLEADVSIDSSSAIIEDLKKRLSDFSFSKSNLLEDIKEKIKETLKVQLNIDCDIEHYINKEKEGPLIILIIGPNGAGKTTTISKFAHLYKQKGNSVVLASSDTFRAGSIDQLEIHAKRLGVRVVKQTYGSDPAAVAFDAVASAKANKIDVVLIDTAGRQDTNVNLMQELSKIKRVVKPHLTIYIGESQAGQAIVEQIEKFDKEIGITGVILTKIDTDPKGGVAISILNELKKPIFYIGTGQEYHDIEKFSPEYIIERII